MTTITRFTKEQLIEDLKASTQNSSGMFEIGEKTICALMSFLTATPAPEVPDLKPDWMINEFHAGWNASRAAMLQGVEQQQNPQQNIQEIIPGGLVEAVNNLLNNDGSRGRYSAIGCGEAREKIELWLAQRQKWESQRSQSLSAGNSPVIPDGWVPCSERLPEETKEPDGGATGYLVLYAEGKEPNGGFNVGVWNVTYLRQWWRGFITHWMPLPAAPQQEGK